CDLGRGVLVFKVRNVSEDPNTRMKFTIAGEAWNILDGKRGLGGFLRFDESKKLASSCFYNNISLQGQPIPAEISQFLTMYLKGYRRNPVDDTIVCSLKNGNCDSLNTL